MSGPTMDEARLLLLLVTWVARLNMCGMRARLNDEGVPPSGGWFCWYDSNSPRRPLRTLRKSYAAAALTAADAAELVCG